MLGVPLVHAWPAIVRFDVGQCHSGIAIRENHDHRRHFAVGDQVVDDDIRMAYLRPFPVVPA
jgi:hypothetical protein